MYKNHNMTQLTLPIETSVRIPQNDISSIFAVTYKSSKL